MTKIYSDTLYIPLPPLLLLPVDVFFLNTSFCSVATGGGGGTAGGGGGGGTALCCCCCCCCTMIGGEACVRMTAVDLW